MTEKADLIGNRKKKLKNNQVSGKFYWEATLFISLLMHGGWVWEKFKGEENFLFNVNGKGAGDIA